MYVRRCIHIILINFLEGLTQIEKGEKAAIILISLSL